MIIFIALAFFLVFSPFQCHFVISDIFKFLKSPHGASCFIFEGKSFTCVFTDEFPIPSKTCQNLFVLHWCKFICFPTPCKNELRSSLYALVCAQSGCIPVFTWNLISEVSGAYTSRSVLCCACVKMAAPCVEHSEVWFCTGSWFTGA